MIRTGAIIEIPLSDQKKGYAQYIIRDRYGPVIQVFDCITFERPEINLILECKPLFPPVITGLFAALAQGLWVSIGFSRVKQFEYPGFVSTFENETTGEASIWYYWDGEKSIRLGHKLPKEYKIKEYLMVWDPHDIVHRIETGVYPFPYKDLILHNKYTPRKS